MWFVFVIWYVARVLWSCGCIMVASACLGTASWIVLGSTALGSATLAPGVVTMSIYEWRVLPVVEWLHVVWSHPLGAAMLSREIQWRAAFIGGFAYALWLTCRLVATVVHTIRETDRAMMARMEVEDREEHAPKEACGYLVEHPDGQWSVVIADDTQTE